MTAAVPPKYIDLIQTDPEEFNKSQEQKQKEYQAKIGYEQFCDEVYHSGKHHPLKARRNDDYRLTDQELESLKTNGVLFKDNQKNKWGNQINTFASSYQSLYNNDMPVFITADSMLYAFHKFYDNYLKYIESTVLIEKLETMCYNMLQNVYKIKPSDKNKKLLESLELYFMVPYILTQSTQELVPENDLISNQCIKLTEMDKQELLNYPTMRDCEGRYLSWKEYNDSVSKQKKILEEKCQYEKEQGFKIINELNMYNKEHKFKLHMFCKVNNIEPEKKSDFVVEVISSSPKFNTIFHQFKCPNITCDFALKYASLDTFNVIIKQIANYHPISLNFNGCEIKMDGTMFKPRGHYTESLELKKYFQAFNWLFKFEICLRGKLESCMNELLTATVLCKVAEPCMKELQEFEEFIKMIVGNADGYTLTTFLPIVNKIIPENLDLTQTVDWILDHQNILLEFCRTQLTQKVQLTKLGDTNDSSTNISIKIIGQGNQIDNFMINDMIDQKLIADDGSIPMRKFPSVFDLVYTVFDNQSIDHNLKDKMLRDEVQYMKHLDKKAKEMHEYFQTDKSQSSSFYAQELKTMRALSQDRVNIYPFNTKQWLQKQAQTQIAHYAEVRHDNVLYVNECYGMMCLCQYADLLVEPVPTFWKELLNLIQLVKSMCRDKHFIELLTNFETIINKFIIFVDCYINHKPLDPKLIEDLSTIVIAQLVGSGSCYYDGWYPKLFQNNDEMLKFKPEIGTMFTAPNDIRGPGGIIHLGTGSIQNMYILVKDPYTNEDKVFIGPVYSAYEFTTDPQTRLNDDEWEKIYQNYKKINVLV